MEECWSVATLAQSVEQRFRKPQVTGSSPVGGSASHLAVLRRADFSQRSRSAATNADLSPLQIDVPPFQRDLLASADASLRGEAQQGALLVGTASVDQSIALVARVEVEIALRVASRKVAVARRSKGRTNHWPSWQTKGERCFIAWVSSGVIGLGLALWLAA
jgi:hypothetical protein